MGKNSFKHKLNAMSKTSSTFTKTMPSASSGVQQGKNNPQGKYVPTSLLTNTAGPDSYIAPERTIREQYKSSEYKSSVGYTAPDCVGGQKAKNISTINRMSSPDEDIMPINYKSSEKSEKSTNLEKSEKSTNSTNSTNTLTNPVIQDVCISCSGNHKFSPFNVLAGGWAKLPDTMTIPIMIVDEESGHFNVCPIRNSDTKGFKKISINDINEIVAGKNSISNPAIYWSDCIEMLGINGLIKLLVHHPEKIDTKSIQKLLQAINCPDWWDKFLSATASTQIDSDSIANSIANSIERANSYRDIIFEMASRLNKPSLDIVKNYKFPIFKRTLNSYRERQKRINEDRQYIEEEERKFFREERERKALEDSLIAIKEREQKELEDFESSSDYGLSFEEAFIKDLTVVRKGKSCKFIASINPESNAFANIVQKAGEASKLQSGVEAEDKIKKAALWEYYKNQEAEIKDGIKYKDYNKGQKKLENAIPEIPVHTDLKKPKPLLTLNKIQKQQYENIWTDYQSKITTNALTNGHGPGFVLDDWQSDSIGHIRNGRSCLITGPTSGGKTYVMMKGMDNIINGTEDQIVIYVSPTFHLAYQTFANVKATFPNRTVAIITAELISIPTNANIIIGTAPQLLNYFVTTKKRFQVGIFDEIHVASNAYYDSSSKSEIIRAKAYSRLISRCENQFIAASATIGGVDVMIQYIVHQMNNGRDSSKPLMTIADIHHVNYTVRAVPLNEYRFVDNSIIHPLLRDENGLEDTESEPVPIPLDEITDPEITSENLFELLIQMKRREMTPAIVFDFTDDIAWKTYVDLINFVESQESADYASYTQMVERTNKTIDKFNTDQKTRMDALPESDNLDSSKMCDGKKGNGKREAGLRAIRSNRIKTYTNMITDAKTILLRSIQRYNVENTQALCDIPRTVLPNEVISKIANIFGNTMAELLKAYPNFHISRAHIDMMQLIKRLEETESDSADPISNISIDKGSYYRFAKSCGMDQLRAIREPGSDEENWKKRKMMIILAEAQRINPKDIDGIIDVVMRGLEFGIAIINPSLPFVIQNIILENLRTKNMGIVIASESMSMGINYPLRSVVIKSPSGSREMNPGKMIQMAGRCGRRGKDTQAHVIFWGIENPEDAHPSYIPELNNFETNFFINNGEDIGGSMIEGQLELAIELGTLYNTFYFYEERKKAVLKASETKTGGRVKVSRHSNSNTNTSSNDSSTDIHTLDDDERERKICEARASGIKLSRSQYIIPTIQKLAIRIGYSEAEADMIASMIANIDSEIISETYSVNSFQKSRDINLIMHMLIELHNTYAMSSNTSFLNFLEEMINILQTCEYRLIKLAN
jgi:superfamily II RNA helicase